MISKPKRILLRISSVLMLLSALPMMLWCLGLIRQAAFDSDYAGLGCFAAATLYVFSMVTAIVGLIFAEQPNRHLLCRVLSYIQLLTMVLLIFPLHIYSVLTLPPLFLLTVLYLFGVGWRNKRDSEHQ